MAIADGQTAYQRTKRDPIEYRTIYAVYFAV